MTAAPRVSIVLPVFNAQYYLAAALASLFQQSLTDFELIAVDDGSTDASPALLARAQAQDPRLTTVTQPHGGLVSALNHGLALARGPYVARMDADDLSRPDRLAKQATFLDQHPRVVACGSWVHLAGQPAHAVWRFPADDAALRGQLVFEPPFCHPAVMLRRAVLTEKALQYEPAYREAEDYALWVRLAEHGELANLPEVLLDYRVHAGQKRQLGAEQVSQFANQIRQAQLARLGLTPTEAELQLHQRLSEGWSRPTRADLAAGAVWLGRLRAANQAQPAFPEPAFSAGLGRRWFGLCRRATWLGWAAWQTYWAAPLSAAVQLSPLRLAKFALRCGLRLDQP